MMTHDELLTDKNEKTVLALTIKYLTRKLTISTKGAIGDHMLVQIQRDDATHTFAVHQD